MQFPINYGQNQNIYLNIFILHSYLNCQLMQFKLSPMKKLLIFFVIYLILGTVASNITRKTKRSYNILRKIKFASNSNHKISPKPSHSQNCSTVNTHDQYTAEKFDKFNLMLQKSRKRAAQLTSKDPQYFSKHSLGQNPDFLWIGCSDSRVLVQTLLQAQPGKIFIHRNVANLALPHDSNVMAVIQYAIERLKITDIIVAGHYGCGGVKAALTNQNFGPLQFWLSNIRKIRIQKAHLLVNKTAEEKQKFLIEENVKQQVLNIASMPCIQHAWQNNQEVNIHGLVYDLNTGLFKNLEVNVSGYDDLPQHYHLFSDL